MKYDSVFIFNLQKRICEKSFYEFVKTAWSIIDNAKYLDSWYVKAICDHMQALYERKFNQLLINIPFRCAKSNLCFVLFPAWVWINEPRESFYTGSHDIELAVRDCRKSRLLMSSDWFKKRWGDKIQFALDQNQKGSYVNLANGSREIFSTGGDITGHGGSFIGLDDPHDVKDVYHLERLKETNIKLSESLLTRFNNPTNDVVYVIMQRLSELDFTAYCLKQTGWVHLCLPMEYEPSRKCKTPIFEDPREIEGETIHPERWTKEALARVKQFLANGKCGVAGQLQQRPINDLGNILHLDWWRSYKECPNFTRIIQTWDTAFKTGAENDYTVCMTIGEARDGYYILEVFRKKMEFPLLKKMFIIQQEKWRPNIILVEDKASGQSLIQETDIKRLPIKPIKVMTDKVCRANAASGMLEAGKWFLPERAAWLADFLDETSYFPNGEHDDQVDTWTMASDYFHAPKRNVSLVIV